MWKKKQVPRIFFLLCFAAAAIGFSKPATGQNEDPPSRVARLSYAQGSVSFEPSGTEDWVAPGINRPMTIGDKIWADSDGRAELQLDGSVIRMSNNTGFSFLNLNDNVTQIQLTAGTVLVRVRRLDQNETYEIDTPNLAFSVLRPGVYRVNVNENGDQTALSIRSGEGEVTGGGASYNVHANDSYVFSGTDQLYANREPLNEDQFEAWASTRDRRWASSRSANYVSEDVIGYEDLDEYGTWRDVPDYGGVWFPRVETADWAPYHYGHWCYVEPWGYTWVDDEPWGFAPFHYGRWVHYEGLWGWVPAPRHVERAEYIRPVYSPALVAWVGGGALGVSVGWFPLGPREVYVPSYPVSRNYVERVNVTNTTVNTTVVNNYYNTTVVNQNTNVTNIKYVNREVPGAIAATTPQAFTGAQPVARNRVPVNATAVASAPVRAVAPPVAPVKQTVLGNVPARARPPAAVQTRTVVAKSAPPPPAPAVEQRLAAVQKNGGKPLSMAQVHQMAPAATAQTHPAVRVVPAAKPSPTPPPAPPNRAAQPANPPPSRPAPNAPASKPPSATPPANRPADRPPTATPPPPRPNQPAPNPAPPPSRPAEHPPANPPQPAHPAERAPERPAAQPPAHNPPTQPPPRNDRPSNAAPVHPNEQPAPARTAPPPSNNPAVNQQHQKEQEQLRARQEQERQRLQQQQEQEHARAAQQQATQEQRQQMEQRHQQQTQQQQQKHAQEQQQQKQQQERQSEEKKKPQPPPEPKH